MKRTTPWLAAVLLLCPLGAQVQPAPSHQEPGQVPGQQEKRPDAAARLKELEAEQEQLFKVWQQQQKEAVKAAEEAKKDGKPIPAMSMRPDFSPLYAKYLAAAKDYPGEDAVQFLMAAVNMGNTPEQRRQVLDLLLDNHLDSPKLADLGGMLPYLDRVVDAEYAKTAIAKIEKHGKNLPLLGWIAFSKHEKTLRSEPATSKAFLDAKAAVAVAVDKAADKQLKRQFDSLVAEQEKFGIGMQAPEITGMDLDGVAFKLSDYRGKVVFLDFWGDW
ncbi:MAG: hypothetical protein ABIP94_18125 [Planctomycetota bacterium]